MEEAHVRIQGEEEKDMQRQRAGEDRGASSVCADGPVGDSSTEIGAPRDALCRVEAENAALHMSVEDLLSRLTSSENRLKRDLEASL